MQVSAPVLPLLAWLPVFGNVCVCAVVDACDCTRPVRTPYESALKADSTGEKPVVTPGNGNWPQYNCAWLFGPTLYQPSHWGPTLYQPSHCCPTLYQLSYCGPTLYQPSYCGPTLYQLSHCGPTLYQLSHCGPTLSYVSSDCHATGFARS